MLRLRIVAIVQRIAVLVSRPREQEKKEKKHLLRKQEEWKALQEVGEQEVGKVVLFLKEKRKKHVRRTGFVLIGVPACQRA